MGRQRAPIQINKMVGGLDTESNPLSYPIEASMDERNLVLNRDGSRSRRKGFDVVGTPVTVNEDFLTPGGVTPGMFLWEVDLDEGVEQLVAVQASEWVHIYSVVDGSIGASLYTFQIPTAFFNFTAASLDPVSFTVFNGHLVVCAGSMSPVVLSYDGTTVSTVSVSSIRVRDFFGVESAEGSDPDTRPDTLSPEHLYNLRNSTFALPRVDGANDTTDLIDPVSAFYTESGDTEYPAENDSVLPHLFANANYSSNRTVERLNPEDLYKTAIETSEAPKGRFIIDLFLRGASRHVEVLKLQDNNPDLDELISSGLGVLPYDFTSRGPTVTEVYAGRMWWSGFGDDVSTGDNRSPNLSSYVAFSQLTDKISDINKCYQKADPTSNVDPNVVDTDGGLIKIDGAKNIRKMIAMDASLFVFAENGVWQISGPDGNGFTATSYTVSKVSDYGAPYKNAIVLANDFVVYWGKSAIYTLAYGQSGWAVSDISSSKIERLYAEFEGKSTAYGFYDEENMAIKWLYGSMSSLGATTEAMELVLDIGFQSYTLNQINNTAGVIGPVAGVLLRDNDEPTYLTSMTLDNTSYTYSFGSYQNDVEDYTSLGGVDSPAYIQTGFLTGGDGRLRKDIPYVTCYFLRTDLEDNGGVEGSCMLKSMWDWTTSSSAHRWSTSRQAYRILRTDDGHSYVITKNRMRGRGHSAALMFESEPGKTFHIYGWEHNLGATTEE